MPVYQYKHTQKPCSIGEIFEIEQPIRDDALEKCPECGGALRRLISRVFVSMPTSDSEYKNMGFTKLVKRDTGVYENVTKLGNESRYMEAGKPETMPDLSNRISD